MKQETKVKFLIEAQESGMTKSVFAFFPDQLYSKTKKDGFWSYSHVGQHCACSLEYANECQEATPDEYKPLLEELKANGYLNIVILNTKTEQTERQRLLDENKNLMSQLNAESDVQAMMREERQKLLDENKKMFDLLCMVNSCLSLSKETLYNAGGQNLVDAKHKIKTFLNNHQTTTP